MSRKRANPGVQKSHPPALAPARAPAPAPARAPAPRAPTTMQMMSEAIQSVHSRKGASLQAIRAHILTKYPEVGPTRIRGPLQRCLRHSLGSGAIVRPAGSVLGTTTIKGRFKLAKPSPPEKKPRQPPHVAEGKQTTEAKKENGSPKRVKTKTVQKKKTVASTKDTDHKMAAKVKAGPVVKLKRVSKQQKVDAVAKLDPDVEVAKRTVRRAPKEPPKASANLELKPAKTAAKKAAAVKGPPS
uniref:sperm-specific protein PHI-2B-like n=1 Tax=Myxine glutinosa TaxID=7769 RepID=UPI00358F12F9